MAGPKPGPTSSQLRFSKLNTTTDVYRLGGAVGDPQGESPSGVTVPAGVVLAVVPAGRGFAVRAVLEAHAVARRSTAPAMRVPLRITTAG